MEPLKPLLRLANNTCSIDIDMNSKLMKNHYIQKTILGETFVIILVLTNLVSENMKYLKSITNF